MKTNASPVFRGFLSTAFLLALLFISYSAPAQISIHAMNAPEAQSHATAAQALMYGDQPQLSLMNGAPQAQGNFSVLTVSASQHAGQLAGLSINHDQVQLIQMRLAATDNVAGITIDAASILPFTGLQYIVLSGYQALTQAQVQQMVQSLPATSNLVILYQQLKDN